MRTLACLDSRVWSGHKKIIVTDPDIYDQASTRPGAPMMMLQQRAPWSYDVTLATSFYHQPVFMFMGNFQILPQITVWRVLLTSPPTFEYGGSYFTSFSHMDHNTWATSFIRSIKEKFSVVTNMDWICHVPPRMRSELISKLYFFTDKKIPRLTLLAHLGIFWTKSFISCHLS